MEGEDFLEEPYSFGECRSYDFTTTAHCNAFKVPDKELHVNARKRGNWVTVIIPDIMTLPGGTKDDNITIDPFLPTELLGSKPRVRTFSGIGKNCNIWDNKRFKCIIIVILNENGTITIKPSARFVRTGNVAEYGDIFKAKGWFDGGNYLVLKMGTLGVQFTYVIDDEHEYDKLTN